MNNTQKAEKIMETMVEKVDLHPIVTLVVVDEFGGVKLLEHVGEDNLAQFLKLASRIDDNPIVTDEFLLDCRGQEIYTLKSYSYLKSISGFFLTSGHVEELVKACNKDGLKFSFIVSY